MGIRRRGGGRAACGVVGSLGHTLLFPRSTIPSIGASGSNAWIVLPIWFFMQFFNGFLALTSARGTQEVAGVAWWAHVGGFLFGAAGAGVMRMRWRNTSW